MKRKASIADSRAVEAINRLKAAREVVYDAETTGLDFKRNAIVGHVLTFGPAPQDSYYLPVRHLGDRNIGGAQGVTTPFNWDGKLHPIERELLARLDRPHLTVIGHNLNFDLRFKMALGFTLEPRFEDTMINEAILDEHVGRYSLESCAHRWKVEAKKSAQIKEYLCSLFPEARAKPEAAMGNYWRLAGDDPVGTEYATGDGTTTWQLRDAQMVAIRRHETWNDRGRVIDIPTLEQVWDVESRLIPVLARMSFKGIKIDEAALSELKKHIKRQEERLANTFPEAFNPKSPTDVRYWMEQHGCTDWPHTMPSKRFPNGQPSFTQGWLETHDAGKQIIEWRKYETLKTTFVQPLEITHMHKGRVHTDFNQLRGDQYGTISGRLSASNPNLQAVPKHDDDGQVVPMGPLYRRLFVPDDGQVWASADYEQIEPRLLAYYSGCKALIRGYLADPPVDAHTAAAMMSNRNWAKLSKAEQKHYRNAYAKRINQTIITGGGKKPLVEKYKIPADEVDQVWADYHRGMPEIRPTQKAMSRRYRDRGFILTLLNRRCRLDDPDRDYVAMSRVLQGGNADVIKIKLVEMDEYLKANGRPLDILNNIHDDVAFQVPEEARKHYDECLRIMQAFGPDDVICLKQKLDGKDVVIPLPVDPGEGKDWGAATYGEQK